ncbi:MAG: hypothetical protein ABIG88_02625 [Patescibacteria group bacterium]|nr:hypothetical protein [Patescibacteria group bacterium]
MKQKEYLKYKICVSGAASTGHCSKTALELSKETGREIARHNGVLVTGATIGVPYWAAIGAKEENGIVIGFSPAASEKAHVRTYRLPTDFHDVIVYTGFNYSGRNLILTRSSDAVIIICGRMGTLNEFSIAFEDDKPIGVLTGSGGTADKIKEIVETSYRGPGKIVYNSDPKSLIDELIKLIKKEKEVKIQ